MSSSFFSIFKLARNRAIQAIRTQTIVIAVHRQHARFVEAPARSFARREAAGKACAAFGADFFSRDFRHYWQDSQLGLSIEHAFGAGATLASRFTCTSLDALLFFIHFG